MPLVFLKRGETSASENLNVIEETVPIIAFSFRVISGSLQWLDFSHCLRHLWRIAKGTEGKEQIFRLEAQWVNRTTLQRDVSDVKNNEQLQFRQSFVYIENLWTRSYTHLRLLSIKVKLFRVYLTFLVCLMSADTFSLYTLVSLLPFGYGGLKIFSTYNGPKKNRDAAYTVHIRLQPECHESSFHHTMKVREAAHKNCSGRLGWVPKNDHFRKVDIPFALQSVESELAGVL